MCSWSLCLAFALGLITGTAQPQAAFVVAHPDDWQLFMGDVAVARAVAGRSVVFVYLTAGGADRTTDYWLAREAGTAASAAAAANFGGGEVAEERQDSCGWVRVRGHRLHRCHFRNTVSYHLRLPDGGYDGSGFAPTRFQSLAKLRSGAIARIDAVDGSAAYQGWDDLTTTVARLLAVEAAGARGEAMEIHSHDADEASNPGDHADHRATALLAGEVAEQRRAGLTRYTGYAIARRPANLPAPAAAAKTLVFMAYDRQRLLANAQWSAYTEAPAAYSAWLFRTYGHGAGP